VVLKDALPIRDLDAGLQIALAIASKKSVTAVNDAADIDGISNGAIPGSHTHVISYRIEGRSNRAKAPYHLAVFQVYIRGTDDPEPILNLTRLFDRLTKRGRWVRLLSSP
jgi:hypothetical protein